MMDMRDQKLFAAIVEANDEYVHWAHSHAADHAMSFAEALDDLGFTQTGNVELRVAEKDPPGQIHSFNSTAIAIFKNMIFENGQVNKAVKDLLPDGYYFRGE